MLILLYILEWIGIIILIAVLCLMCVWMIYAMKAKVPFVPVPNSILPYIHKALGIRKDSVVYDLGCGDARVLSYSASLVPEAKYIGIENTPFPLFLAHCLNWWNEKMGKGSVEILNQDFFTRDLSDATHIFTYLYPEVMDDLLTKFDKELKSGTRVVSTSFQFTLKKPIAEIDLERGKHKLARKLYVYEF